MASTFTPNLNLELQGVGDNVGTWGTVLNTAALTVLDTALGGMQTLSLSNVNVTVTTTQSQNNFIKLTGTLTGNVIITFPAIGRTYWIKNATTGSFSVTIARSGGATTVVIPQGYAGLYGITSDGVTDLSVLAVTSGTASAITISNSTIVLKQATDPAPTAQGDMQWSTLFKTLNIGDSVGTKRFWPGATPGLIYGCSIANNVTDAVNDIDFAAGTVADSTNLFYMAASALTKRLDATWAAGTNQGGLFSGAIANDTYHCFIILNPTTGTVDAGFDTSTIAANRPAGYTYYRRVGSIVRSGGSILAFTQTGSLFYWSVQKDDYSATASTSRTNVTLTVPTDIVVLANIVSFWSEYNSQLRYALITPLTAADTVPSAAAFSIALAISKDSSAENGAFLTIPTDTSARISYRASAAVGPLIIQTIGWTDTRGQFG